MRKVLLLLIVVTIAVLSLVSTGQTNAQTCSVIPPTNTGTVTLSTTTTAGTYRVWSRMKAADSSNNSYYLKIDSNCAVVVGDSSQISSTSWTWVDYQNGVTTGKINATLASGSHVITLIGNEPGVSIDKILLTQNLNCVPVNDGSNCPVETPTSTPVPTSVPTNTPTLTPKPTTTPTPTPTPKPTSTPTPTPTPTPIPSPTPTPLPAQTVLKFSTVKLHGIGTGGDNTNPTGLGNSTPITPVKSITVEIYKPDGTLLTTAQGNIIYSSNVGYFSGDVTVDSTGLISGPYLAKVKANKYLRKQLPGIITINTEIINQMPAVTLIAGDANADGMLSVLDFNAINDCFSDLLPPKNCSDPVKKSNADIDDDGIVKFNDFTLFTREISVISGD